MNEAERAMSYVSARAVAVDIIAVDYIVAHIIIVTGSSSTFWIFFLILILKELSYYKHYICWKHSEISGAISVD